MDAFQTAVLSWHDFFLAVASASAALLGLLFVGVSIGLSSVAADDRTSLLVRARQAFANLSLILVASLCLLIPGQSSQALGFQLTIVGVFGLFGVVERLGQDWRRSWRAWVATLARIAWSLLGDVILLAVALTLWQRGPADPNLLYWLVDVVFVFLINAAFVSWALLVQVSREPHRAGTSRRKKGDDSAD
jgi:hypothetical protein